MLEFDGQPLDPAIVSAQPMKSAQMVCVPGKDGNLHIYPKRSCTIESHFPLAKHFYKTVQVLEMHTPIAHFLLSNDFLTLQASERISHSVMWWPFCFCDLLVFRARLCI